MVTIFTPTVHEVFLLIFSSPYGIGAVLIFFWHVIKMVAISFSMSMQVKIHNIFFSGAVDASLSHIFSHVRVFLQILSDVWLIWSLRTPWLLVFVGYSGMQLSATTTTTRFDIDSF